MINLYEKFINKFRRNKGDPAKDHISDWVKILQLFLSHKNWVLKYGDENESISDILKTSYKELAKQDS